MKFKILTITFLFISFSYTLFSQEPKLYDKLEDKVIIGFPGITTEQLNLISVEYAKYNQIATAKYIYKDHNCLLITLNSGTTFTTYSSLLKVIHNIYNTRQCYFKPNRLQRHPDTRSGRTIYRQDPLSRGGEKCTGGVLGECAWAHRVCFGLGTGS